jgi:hypothetical protein
MIYVPSNNPCLTGHRRAIGVSGFGCAPGIQAGFGALAGHGRVLFARAKPIGLRRRKMIGHVAPLDTSSTYASAPLNSSVGVTTPQAGGSVAGSQMAQSVTAMQINAQVAHLLQGIGGAAENNQLLQLMIGLMILITLLQGSQQPQAAADPFKSLAGLSGARASAAGATVTNFTIEQTTVTWAAPNLENTQAASDGQGQKVDLAA